MPLLIFITLSSLYIGSLAIVDGLFNRLVFREDAKFPYESKEKKSIYKLPEWKYIGVIFLIILPVVLPCLVSYFIGGLYYVLVYLSALMVIQWDMIFGKLVFDNWFGDKPSIALPFIGWINTNLSDVVWVRIIIFLILLVAIKSL